MNATFLSSFNDFRNSKAMLAFVKKPSLNATLTEINFLSFNIDIANFEMQLVCWIYKIRNRVAQRSNIFIIGEK